MTVDGNAVAVIDPDSNLVTGAIAVGRARAQSPSARARSGWRIATTRASRGSTRHEQRHEAFPVVDTPTGLAASDGATWVVGSTRQPFGERQTDRPAVRNRRPEDPDRQRRAGRPRFGGGARQDRLDRPVLGPAHPARPANRPRRQEIDPNTGPTAIAVGAGAIWVADSDAGTVTRVDPTGSVDADRGRRRPVSDRARRRRRLGGQQRRQHRRPHRPGHAGSDHDDPRRAGSGRDRRRRGLRLGRQQRRRHRQPHRPRGKQGDRDDRGRREPAEHRRRGRADLGDRRTGRPSGAPGGSSGGTARLSRVRRRSHGSRARVQPLSWRLLAATCAKLFN